MTTPDLEMLGRSGLRQWGGYVSEEQHPKLVGSRGARVYREMADNSAIIGAALYVVRSSLRGVQWRCEPAGDGSKAREAAAFVDECRGDMSQSWEETLSEILSMLVYGWAYHELVYKVRRGPDETDPRYRSAHTDGRIGWRKLQGISQDTLDRWEFDEGESLRGMWQRTAQGFSAFVPIEKALLFRTETARGNPEGRSLLRNAHRSWRFATNIEELEGIGCERDLAGLPTMEVPPELMSSSATEAQKALRSKLEAIVQKVRRNERDGLLLPAEAYTPPGATAAVQTGYRFRLLSSSGSRQFDTDRVIRRHESRIAMTMLAEFLLLGTEPNGSRSLADTKTGLFAASLGAVLDSIAGVFNTHGIPRLLALNGVPRDLWPQLVHGDIEAPDLQALATALQGFVAAGALVPGPADERRIRELAGLPEMDLEAEPDARDTDPGAAPVIQAPAAEAVADTALNGAQVSSLLEIVRAVVAGEIPRDGAVAIIVRAFNVDAAAAEAMLGDAGFKPAAPAAPPAGPPAGAPT